MIHRDQLTSYLDELLSVSQFQDYAPNGLQVEGRSSIRTICTAVTASVASIEAAIALQADVLLVHHGFYWRGEESVVTGMRRQRLARLLNHDINLLAYHLPLDCHATLGNNVLFGSLIGAVDISGHMASKTPNLLWTGSFREPLSPHNIMIKLTKLLNRQPLHISGEQKNIQKIAWCTGAAQDFIEQAKQLGVDAYFSGEISERTYYQAKELNIHYFACGHHATERFGIQALGEHLATTFQLTHQFIDSDNPV